MKNQLKIIRIVILKVMIQMIRMARLLRLRVRFQGLILIGYLSYVTLKQIVSKDYEDWLKLNKIENQQVSEFEPQEDKENDRIIKENMMRTSADFKIEIQDHQTILEGAQTFTYNDKEDPYFSNSNQRRETKKNDSDSDILEEDDDEEDESIEIEDEFTSSCINKISPELTQTLLNLKKLRTKLSKQVKKCVFDMRKDMKKFQASVKINIEKGDLFADAGEKSINNTKKNVHKELALVKSKLLEFKDKLDRDIEMVDESQDKDK